MQSEIRIFPREGAELQRVHLVRFDDWSQLDFLRPQPSDRAFDCFHKIYQQYLLPAAPWAFGNLVMFRLPGDVAIPEELVSRYAGRVTDPLTIAALALRRGAAVMGERILFRDGETKQLWKSLRRRNCIRIVQGKLPVTTIIPVSDQAGFLTETEQGAALKVNSSFFIMDPFDCATPYDHVGTPFGLLVKDGIVESPPLFGREALLVKADGSVAIDCPDLRKLKVRIGDEVFTHGENARFYSRPEHAVVASGEKKLVIVGRTVAAVESGMTSVPASGFVLCPKGDCHATPGEEVTYEGMEDIRFGIQVGNSILREGVKTEKFISKFYNIRGVPSIPFPPSLYPLDFANARAARIALGADQDGRPMVFWAEGAAKLGHTPGQDSCGASLMEMAQMGEELGMVNGVNLDGGGSAQLLLHNRRSLQISDRNAGDLSESERPVPMALIIR